MTPDDFRRLALSQPKAVEVYCVLRRSFASLGGPAESVATVRLTSEQQAMFIDASPKIFVPASGGWGRPGATNVVLAYAHEAIVESALAVAWRNIVPTFVKSTERKLCGRA
jgi:hypothetical protein